MKKTSSIFIKIKSINPKKWFNSWNFKNTKRNKKNKVVKQHQSFKKTKHMTKRTVAIEGYFKFSSVVVKTIWKYKNFFLKLCATAIVVSVLLFGLVSQVTYNNFREAIKAQTTTADENLTGSIYNAGLLLFTTTVGGASTSHRAQPDQFLVAIIAILIWLIVVWYLRNALANNKVKFRDAVYNAGAPIVSVVLVMFYILLQLLPLLIFIIFYAAAVSTNFASSGVEAMVLNFIAILILILSVYWIEGSILALAVATLPGIYPMKAISIASELVTGRRMMIIWRLLWHLACVSVAWIVIGIPVVLFNELLVNWWDFFGAIPVIPVFVLIATTICLIWTYVYLFFLYRRLVEDESASA